MEDKNKTNNLISLFEQFLTVHNLGISYHIDPHPSAYNRDRLDYTSIFQGKGINKQAINSFLHEIPATGYNYFYKTSNPKPISIYVSWAKWLINNDRLPELLDYFEVIRGVENKDQPKRHYNYSEFKKEMAKLFYNDSENLLKYLTTDTNLQHIYSDPKILSDIFKSLDVEQNSSLIAKMQKLELLKLLATKKYIHSTLKQSVSSKEMAEYDKFFKFRKQAEITKGYAIEAANVIKIDLQKKALQKYSVHTYPTLKVETGIGPGCIFAGFNQLSGAFNNDIQTKELLDIKSINTFNSGDSYTMFITVGNKYNLDFYDTLVDTYIDYFYRNYKTAGRWNPNVALIAQEVISKQEKLLLFTDIQSISKQENIKQKNKI